MTPSIAQAPGFYRHRVGTITVTALNDGLLAESPGILSGIGAGEAAALLAAAFLPPEPQVTINGFLVETDGGPVLIDAGWGDGMQPRAGRLLDNLRAAGVMPEAVVLVLLTHMHPDHVGGLVDAAGSAVFPRARVLVPEADAALFLDPEIALTVPDEAKPVFAKARAVADAYAGRFERFTGDAELVPGIRPVALPGHSPGHTGFRIEDSGETLLVWGDVVHVPGVQFTRPEVGMVFDADLQQARATRLDVFARVARERTPIAGMHMPFPGLAHLVVEGAGYRFVPVLWDPGAAGKAG